MKKSLLDEIAARLDCVCLSDLRQWSDVRAFLDCIAGIPQNAYSLVEWNECAQYLTPQTKSFGSEDEVRRFLEEAQNLR